MRYYGFYETSGRIEIRGECMDQDFDKQSHPDLTKIELPSKDRKWYVDVSVAPHEVKEKTLASPTINKTTIVADGVDMVSITNLHNPTKVVWPDGLITEETDGEASFTLDLEGDYTITLDAAPYVKEVINVTATAPA